VHEEYSHRLEEEQRVQDWRRGRLYGFHLNYMLGAGSIVVVRHSCLMMKSARRCLMRKEMVNTQALGL
jgi:hypothetical protein